MKIKDKDLYYVGGVVRDEILGLPSVDIDFCYEGNALEYNIGLKIIKRNPDFGTIRVLDNDGNEIDIASTRTETYPKAGHLPVVDKIGCSLIEDLRRRDFTINAMAKNTETGEIVDFFNGLNDIKEEKLKVLHDNSFIDDPTRIIRGLKFSVRFGFELDEHTKELQEKYLENINYDMSFHRLKKELKETFDLNSELALNKFINEKIYKLLGKNQTIPKLNNSISTLNEKYKPNLVYMTFLGLFNLENLELNNDEKAIIEAYNKIKDFTSLDDVEIYKTFNSCPIESIILYAATIDTNIAKRYLEHLSSIKLNISGNDLLKLGIKQGKIYKEVFEELLQEKIKKPEMERKQEIEFVKERFMQ